MMLSIIKKIIAPLLSLFIFMLGNGLFTTLIPVRLHAMGVSTILIGAMTGLYYLGLACGSFNIERFILRVGHIRAFSTFASALAVISLLQGIFSQPVLWLLLRLLAGFSTAGIFIVIESWLLLLGTIQTRGQVLAIYMIVLYIGQALGQFLIMIQAANTLLYFAIVAMSASLAVIPLAMTKSGVPQIDEPASLSFSSLYRASASGVAGCMGSGLLLGAIYGLLPLFILQQSSTSHDVALLMALTIFGGMSLQYPMGRLSDYIERRTVLIFLTAFILVCSIIPLFVFHWFLLSAITLFLFGGFAFTLYPISISHACDTLPKEQLMAGTQGLLLAYSVGAAIGPFAASLLMRVIGSNGLFIYCAIVAMSLLIFIGWRRLHIAPTLQEENFVSMPQTTPMTAELDPRANMEKNMNDNFCS